MNSSQDSLLYSSKKIISGNSKNTKILIVDDQWEIRFLLNYVLDSLGFCCFEATNGQDGLHKAETFLPDLILTDIEMPIMNGLEMILLLRALPQLKDTAIIVSSASVLETTRNKSLAVGGNEFLPKPLQIDDLLNVIQKYLQLEWIYEEDLEQIV